MNGLSWRERLVTMVCPCYTKKKESSLWQTFWRW
jgi:hypothetical protein